MSNDIDINTSCTVSKFFWKMISAKNKGIDISQGEQKCKIIFFKSLPDNFYDLINESGANLGKVKGILDGVTIPGCEVATVNGSPIMKEIYYYPIFRSESGEDGFYIVIYDRDNGVVVSDTTPYTDISTLCKNIILNLNSEEHTIRGFLLQTSGHENSNYNDYLIAYCNMSNPIVATNNLAFTRNTRIVNVGVCNENSGGVIDAY